MTHVFGAGIAGVTAAIALAKRGRKVRLLEHAQHLGGRAISTSTNGFILNLGPHALYKDGPACRTLVAWGIVPSGQKPELGPDSFLIYDRQKFPVLSGAKDLMFSKLLSVSEKLDAGNALRKLQGTVPADANLSLSQWLETEVSTPKVRQLVQAYVRVSTYTNEPDRLSARSAFQQFQLAAGDGVLYLDGGWQSMVDALEQLAIDCGVDIERGSRITDVPPGSILAIPPQQVTALTGAKFEGLHPVRMACLDLGLSDLPPKAALFALGIDQPFYFSVHSEWAKIAKGPNAVVHIGKYLGSSTADRSELEDFADLAMPGWRERVLVDRYLPEMTVSHTSIWIGRNRPDVRAIPGVFLAGDWIGNEGMLSDACFASALMAAELA